MNRTVQTKKPGVYITLGVAALALWSYGFWWSSDQKKETAAAANKPKPTASSEQRPGGPPAAAKPVAGKPSGKATDTARQTLSGEAASPVAAINQDRAEVVKIQDELKQIVTRTQQLQSKARDDRSQIAKIMDRARIHEQILRTISTPQPVRVSPVVNVDEALRREKLRLIAQETSRTQAQLRALEASRAVEHAARANRQLQTLQIATAVLEETAGQEGKTEVPEKKEAKPTKKKSS